MAIKKFNPVVPNMERPLQLTDLQEFWNALNEVFDNQEFRVIAGLNYADSSGFLSAGVASYQGQLYYYNGGEDIEEGTTLYYEKVAGANRTFSNGISYPFDYSFVITSDVPEGAGGTLLPASLNNAAYLNSKRLGAVAAGSITNDKLAQAAVTADKLNQTLVSYRLSAANVKAISTSPAVANLTLVDFIQGASPATRQTRYVKLTSTENAQGTPLQINVSGVDANNQQNYPTDLLLIIQPPLGWDVKFNVQGWATGSTSTTQIGFQQDLKAPISGSIQQERIIVCALHKINTFDYAVVNAYQTTSFNLPF